MDVQLYIILNPTSKCDHGNLPLHLNTKYQDIKDTHSKNLLLLLLRQGEEGGKHIAGK